jgi:hypothetical protein
LNVLNFPVPAAAKIGATFARFRISANGDLNPTGGTSGGEVEDYRVGISEAMDFGDAPVSGATGGGFNYPTRLSQNGARHRVVQEFWLGQLIDAEPDGQPNSTATGDDINPTGAPKDEEGVLFISSLIAGQVAQVEVFCTMGGAIKTGRLNTWVDFNRDGDWNDEGEQIFRDEPVGPGVNLLSFLVPGSAAGGNTFARFRLNENGKLGVGGFASEGEVEDYQVNVTAALDFGDAPDTPESGGNYPTLLAQDGARHSFRPDLCLGTVVDGESDGQPKPDALGDDENPPGVADDEDGVLFTSSITPGQTASVSIFATLPVGFNQAYVNAWVDFNRDGDWDDAGEHIFAPTVVAPGLNSRTFPVPAGASQGGTFARFRISSARALDFRGLADDGEVEDYAVNISGNLDFGDAPRLYSTLLAANGARHVYNPDVFLGTRIDTEPDGQPNATATGDDLVGPDEDGVLFTSPIVPGATATVQVRASTTGLLHAWMDFNGNSSWADVGEKIFNGVGVTGGLNNLSFTVPASAKTGATFARFRYTTQSAILDFVGLAPNGEVEDYRVSIIPDRERCDLDCRGREFWLTFPGNYDPAPELPTLPQLRVHGPVGTTGLVEIASLGYLKEFTIPPSQALTFDLPVEADLDNLNDAVTNKGIHVIASQLVNVTGFNHVRYTTDSYLALNTSVIGTAYVVQGYGNVHTGVPPLNGSQFALVATESNTVVTIIPSVTTGARAAGVPYNLVLHTGDTYQLRNTEDSPADLSGTLIKSDKPIAVFGGHQCANVPSSNEWFCDYLVEQLLPVNTWGNEFYTAPLATRSFGDTVRILAAYNNTTVYINGAAYATVDQGKFVQLNPILPLQITSDRPVFVAQYANSGDFDLNDQADPFMLTVQGTRHYSSSYRLWAPHTDFPANYAHLIVPTAFTGTIQLNGVAVGAGAFAVIPGTAYSYARVAVSPGTTHTVTGSVPFGASIYGWAEYDSYGHPGCFYFGDVVPPRINPSTGAAIASVADYPNTPGFVPTPDFASSAAPTDNCSQDTPSPTQTPRSSVLLAPGVHVITLSLADNNGNVAETNVILTVVDPSPVVIECPRDIALDCTSSNGAVVNFQVNAFTAYETNVAVVSTPPSGSLFPPGVTVVNNVATSLAGNTGTCSFTVTVRCPGEITVTRGTGNTLNLNWTGSSGFLERAPTVLGPWQTVTGGVNSVTLPITTTSNAFFRIRH